MKLIRKQYKRVYKNRKYIFYTRVIILGVEFEWKLKYNAEPSVAIIAAFELESKGYEYYHD